MRQCPGTAPRPHTLRALRWLVLPLLSTLLAASAAAADETARLYAEQCAACHGPDRLGITGPALLPEAMPRLKPKAARRVIAEGRPATQMEGFSDRLSGEEIDRLVEWIYTPPAQEPTWREARIRASHIQHNPPGDPADRPRFSADPLNLFVVVETGDHHITLLDGDRFEPIHRFPTRRALHGGPKYSSNGRYLYYATRDGWIVKYDLHRLRPVAEIRVGLNTRNLAVSADDRFVIAANYLPHTLVLLDARDLTLRKVIDVRGANGASSRVSAVYTARPRESFIAALKDVPEVWEISYADPPPAGFSGWVHDYREASGDASTPERFPVRRITVDDYLDDFFFDPDYLFLIGASRNGGGQIVDLDAGRVIKKLAIPGMPHLGSGITWEYEGRTVLATPNLREGVVTVIDLERWEIIKRIETLGSGFFLRGHENSPYVWVDVFFGEHRDALHIIDKERLEIVKTVRPEPGRTAAHVEFTRDGSHALVSIWERDGAIVVYDANTLEEVKRLPMSKPSGKYNVWNKTRLSSGTSH